MKILTFIPVFERREITELCYKALLRLYDSAPADYHFHTLILASNLPDAQLAHKYGFDVRMLNNKPIGTKLNKGLEYAFERYQFDYLFQLNSDNILHLDFWDYFSFMLIMRKPFFGCNHIAFFDSKTKRLLKYNYMSGSGIRFIRHDILKGAARKVHVNNPTSIGGLFFNLPSGEHWIPKARYKANMKRLSKLEKIQLWNPTLNKGLDNFSSNAIQSAHGVRAIQHFPHQDNPEPLVMDIKSSTNIHSFDEFLNEPASICTELTGKEKQRILSKFPELQYYARPA